MSAVQCLLFKSITPIIALFLLVNTTNASEQAAGFVDTVEIANGQITVSGWAGAAQPGNSVVMEVEFHLGSWQVSQGRVERFERPDVVAVTGRSDWLNSGWRTTGKLPSGINPGEHAFTAAAIFRDGTRIDLLPTANVKTVYVSKSDSQTVLRRIETILALAIIFGLLMICGIYARVIASRITKHVKFCVHDWQIIATAIAIAFIVFVSAGVTGSSLSVGLKSSSAVEASMPLLLGEPRPIRSDEWLVWTPLAIAQAHHKPKFPVVNHNLGPDGQNMLLVGMTSVPIYHISALARPATWGFFFLDLRRALAWYWWFPLFGCVFALWGMMCFLSPRQWGLGLGFAAIFVSSAYVAAWSTWPAYTVFFPATAFCLFLLLMRVESVSKLIILAIGLGISVAGFVLILYPPWQVSVAYLFLAIAAGVIIRDRLVEKFNLRRALALALAFVIASAICFAWWYDAQEAIDIMRATVYPGNRTALPGGGLRVWELMRGVLNFYTLYSDGGGVTNQTEEASFIYFFPLLVVAAIFRLFKQQMPSWPEVAIYSYCLLLLWFQFFGFSSNISELTLWGRVTERRTDVALGLASILLCGLALSDASEAKRPLIGKASAGILAVLWASFAFYAMLKTPEGVRTGIPISLMLATGFLMMIMGFWLLIGERVKFISASLLWSVAVSLPFNPMFLAPRNIVCANKLLSSKSHVPPRVLVIGSQVPAMMLLAAGVPVANGVFYYPQNGIWTTLDPKSEKANVTNRYQHLIFVPGQIHDGSFYRIEAPRPDVVRVVFDPARFDFSLTSAGRIFAPANINLSLSSNSHVKYVDKVAGWVIYDVI